MSYREALTFPDVSSIAPTFFPSILFPLPPLSLPAHHNKPHTKPRPSFSALLTHSLWCLVALGGSLPSCVYEAAGLDHLHITSTSSRPEVWVAVTWKSSPAKSLGGSGFHLCPTQPLVKHLAWEPTKALSTLQISKQEGGHGDQSHTGPGGTLTQALNHRIQHSHSSSIYPRVLGVQVLCNSDDDGEQHGVQVLFEEGDHLGEGLQRPLAHFLVGILKPWGESIKDLLRKQKPRTHGNPGWAGLSQCRQLGAHPAQLSELSRDSSCIPDLCQSTLKNKELTSSKGWARGEEPTGIEHSLHAECPGHLVSCSAISFLLNDLHNPWSTCYHPHFPINNNNWGSKRFSDLPEITQLVRNLDGNPGLLTLSCVFAQLCDRQQPHSTKKQAPPECSACEGLVPAPNTPVQPSLPSHLSSHMLCPQT